MLRFCCVETVTSSLLRDPGPYVCITRFIPMIGYLEHLHFQNPIRPGVTWSWVVFSPMQ